MWPKIADLILKNRLVIFILVGLTTLFMIWSSSHIRIAYNDMKVLPGNDSASIFYLKFKKQFGEDGSVMVLGIKSPKIREYKILNKWKGLSLSISKIPGITNSLALTNLFVLKKDTLQQKFKVDLIEPKILSNQKDADSLWKNIRNLPFYKGFITNKDETSTLMAVSFDQKVLNDHDRLKVVQNIIDLGKGFEKETKVRVHFSGLPYIRSMMAEMVLKEFIQFLCISILITALILLILYRNFYSFLFPILIVMIGVVWSLGLMALLGFKITLLTGIIPPIVVVIGVPNSILILNKYRLEYGLLKNQMNALTKATSTISFTIFIANITTAIGFGVFYFTKSQILEEFGITAFLSIMGTYLLSIVLIPCIFSFLPPPPLGHLEIKEGKTIRNLLGFISYQVEYRRKWIYAITLVFLVFGFYGLSKIQVNGFIVDDLPTRHPVYQDLKFFESEFTGVLPFEISIDTKRKNGVRNLDLLGRIEDLENLMSHYPNFTKALSINQLIKYGKQTVYNGNPNRYTLPSNEEIGFILSYVGNIPKNSALTHSYLDSNSQVLRVSFQMSDMGSAKMSQLVSILKPKVDSIFPPKKYQVQFTGSSILFIKGTNYLVTNLFQSLALAIVLISLIMIYLFRTPRMVLISLIPNLIPLVLTAGIMGFSGINLKPTTILIFSIAFGLASDQTIYFLTKYRLDLKSLRAKGEKIDPNSLVGKVIQETGLSMIYTAIILFCGFSIFDFSTFGGTVSLGVLISLTMIFAILTNILLLPSMLLSIAQSEMEKD